MLYLETTLIFFVGLLLIRAVETWFSVPGSKLSDETRLVRSRLSSEVANLLDKSGTRVIRILGHQCMLAQTRLVVPRTSIFIDYSERAVSRDLENFLIAHEIAHLRGRHVLINLFFECTFLANLTSLAVRLTVGNHSFWQAALIAIPLITAGVLFGFIPLTHLIIWTQEFNADAFAAKYIGVAGALEQLELLQTMIPASWKPPQRNLAARAKKMRSRLINIAAPS